MEQSSSLKKSLYKTSLNVEDFDEPSPQGNAMFRSFTLDFAFDNPLARSATTFFGGATPSHEPNWTDKYVAEYVSYKSRGVDGDMPMPAGFTREYRLIIMCFQQFQLHF